MPDGTDLVELRQSLTGQFDDGELRTLCFDLRVDYASLPGESKADKARELVAYCDRHGRIAELEDKLRQLHPHVPKAIHDDLPHQPYFFGREAELARIKDALDPEAAGWGVLIDGAGGIGKTALAIRAGHLAPVETFPIKIFLSAKTRELLPHGEQKLEDYQLLNFVALLAELARELGEDEIAKMNPNERANEMRRALVDRRALIIIDNLETFEEPERERLFQFLRRLPRSCKVIVTSRRRTDVAAEIIRLDRLTQEAAHALIAKIAERNKLLARTSEAERQQLYETAGGNPLLIEWLAGQLGREGSKCRTIANAIAFMQAAPSGNDPLEYIFGDLLDTFTESETAVLAALSHFTLPAKTRWIAEMANLSLQAAQTTLEDLANRALVAADTQFQTIVLPPLAAAFLRHKRPDVIAQTGGRLIDRVFALVLESGGYDNYEGFALLDAEWPTIAAALPLFLQGENKRLQILCRKLENFMNFYGRWDERLSLCLQAEERAVNANDANSAGWRSYRAGYTYYLRGMANEASNCARRAESHWRKSSAREKGFAIRLRGKIDLLEKDYVAAMFACQEVLTIRRAIKAESTDVAIALNDLAEVERFSGDDSGAEHHYREALRIAKLVGFQEGIATYTGNLAELALEHRDWHSGELLAREALVLAEAVGRQQSVASNCRRIAQAHAKQGRAVEGLPYAQRAVEIYGKLRSPELEKAQAVLKECEEAATDTSG